MSVRAGPKSVYKPDEEEWLRTACDEYMALVTTKSEDAPAQKTFRDQKIKEFLDTFKDQLIDKHHKLEAKPVTNLDSWSTVSILISPLLL